MIGLGALSQILFAFFYIDILLKFSKQRKRIEELEKENADLRSKIEWGIHNM